MQCCGHILQDSFDTKKTFLRSVNPEFERKVDVQNRTFGWTRFKNFFFKLLNNDKKCKQNSTVNLLVVQEQVEKIKINLIIENK